MPRARHVTLVVLLTLLALAAAATPATAANRASGTIVIEEGRVHDGDLTAFAGSVVVRGTVTGDLDGIMGSLAIPGTVTGDVDVAAGSLELASGGAVGGSLSAAAGSVYLNGNVGEDVDVGAGSVELGPDARVGGDVSVGAGSYEQDPGARVDGSVTERRSWQSGFGGAAWDVGDAVVAFFANLVVGTLLLLLAPRFTRESREVLFDDALRTGALGLVFLVALPVAFVILLLTIIGIPVALVGLPVVLVLAWVGYVLGGFTLGSWVLLAWDERQAGGTVATTEGSRAADLVPVEDDGGEGRSPWTPLVLGLALLGVLGLIPWLGDLFRFLVFLGGLGSVGIVLKRRWDARRSRRSSAGAA